MALSGSTLLFLAIGLVLVGIRGHRGRRTSLRPHLIPRRLSDDARTSSPWSITSARYRIRRRSGVDDSRNDEDRESLVGNASRGTQTIPQMLEVDDFQDGGVLRSPMMAGVAALTLDPRKTRPNAQSQYQQAWAQRTPSSPPHPFPGLPAHLSRPGRVPPWPPHMYVPNQSNSDFEHGGASYFLRVPPLARTRRDVTDAELDEILESTAQRLATGTCSDKPLDTVRRQNTPTKSSARHALRAKDATTGVSGLTTSNPQLRSSSPLPTISTSVSPPGIQLLLENKPRASTSTESVVSSPLTPCSEEGEEYSTRTSAQTTPARSNLEKGFSFAKAIPPLLPPRIISQVLRPVALGQLHSRRISWPPGSSSTDQNESLQYSAGSPKPLWSHPVDSALRQSLRERSLSAPTTYTPYGEDPESRHVDRVQGGQSAPRP